MTKTIQQKVEFSNISPKELFEIYIDSEKHSAATNSKALINREVGGKFMAFDGNLFGKILQVVPNYMIVQSWRGNVWKEADLDSILILTFRKTAQGAQIDLVHANIPEHAYDKVNEQAWHERYWKPWKVYLAQRSKNAKA